MLDNCGPYTMKLRLGTINAALWTPKQKLQTRWLLLQSTAKQDLWIQHFVLPADYSSLQSALTQIRVIQSNRP